jgi:hypothetical protein
MKRTIVLGVTLALAAAARGYLGEIVTSYPCPEGRNAYAMSVGDRYVYLYLTGPFHVYRMERWTGSIVSSYAPAISGTVAGMAFEEDPYLWMHSQGFAPVWFHRCHEATGSIYSSMPIITQYCASVDFQTPPGKPAPATAILMSVSIGIYGQHLLRFTTAGSFIDSFKPENQSWSEVAWDYGNALIWMPKGSINPYFFAYNTHGSLVTSFAPTTAGHIPQALDYYGEYLWVSSRTLSVPHVLVIHCPALYEAVAPASVGRIKALFR